MPRTAATRPADPWMPSYRETSRITNEESRSPTLEVTRGFIRLHQLKGTTSGNDGNGGDLVVFELWRLTPSGPDVTAPEIDARVPTTGATVRRLRQIQITFSEDVVGVDAADLLVDGAPATGVSGAVFRFPASKNL